MKPKFVKCEHCKAEIPAEMCNLASHRTVIDDQEYVFCCQKCAEQYKQKQKKK